MIPFLRSHRRAKCLAVSPPPLPPTPPPPQKKKRRRRRPSGVPVLVDLVFAFYAGNCGLDSHRDTRPVIIFNLINQELSAPTASKHSSRPLPYFYQISRKLPSAIARPQPPLYLFSLKSHVCQAWSLADMGLLGEAWQTWDF